MKGSYHMEIEALIRGINFLHELVFEVGLIVTDRYRQIAKWVRENLSATDHRYDVWHLVKCTNITRHICLCK